MLDAKHVMTRDTTGAGITDSTTAICSCGWRGNKHFGHDDFQMTNVRADEVRHLSSVNAHSDVMRFAAGIACADTLGGLA